MFHGRRFIITCDICNCEMKIAYSTNYATAYQFAKNDGWKAFKNDSDEWIHKCPDCVEKR